MSRSDSNTNIDDVQTILADAGIVGFNTETDALQDTRIGRVYYIDNGEIKWAGQSAHQNQWLSPSTLKPERFADTLESIDSDDLKITDKTVFNELRTGPLESISHAHDGLAWGITLLCRHRLERGDAPNYRTLQAVPGIGEKLAGDIINNFSQYTTPEPTDANTDT